MRDGTSWKQRNGERMGMVLPARCRTRSGFQDRGVISDLSTGGCRYESSALLLNPGDPVVVRPQGLEGMCGYVRWVEGRALGIEFATPLYGPVVAYLHRQHGHSLGRLVAAAIRRPLREAA